MLQLLAKLLAERNVEKVQEKEKVRESKRKTGKRGLRLRCKVNIAVWKGKHKTTRSLCLALIYSLSTLWFLAVLMLVGWDG